MLELTLRSTAVLIAAWVLVRAMPRATAATRHLVWHTALVASLIAAVASLAPLPKVAMVPQVPVLPMMMVSQQPQALAQPATDAVTPTNTQSSLLSRALAVPGALSALGTLGTLAAGLWFAAGWVAAARISRRARPAPAAWQLEVNDWCARLHLTREVRVRLVDDHISPLATGLRRAMILLPRSAAAWSDDRRHAVLLHELAHIKRHDCRVQLVAQVACALYWFNPLVWMAASALRSERERACDDEVLRLGAQASSYAAHLLDIARELRPTLAPSAALAMARPSELEGRLLSVLAAGRARVPARATRWVVVGLLSLTTAVALSATSHVPPAAVGTPVFEPATDYVVANDVVLSSREAAAPVADAEATLAQSDNPEDRERATLALAFTSGRDVVPALLKALHDSDSQVREKAAIGLALRRDQRIVDALIAAMNDPDSQVREKVAIALGATGDARAQDALTRALGDPDRQVREKATSALVLLGLTRSR